MIPDFVGCFDMCKIKHFFQSDDIVSISHKNISELQNILIQKYDVLIGKTNLYSADTPILISARAHDKILHALSILQETLALLEKADLPEKIASTLYCALKSLEEILGEVDMNDVYQKIFSTFCIGK